MTMFMTPCHGTDWHGSACATQRSNRGGDQTAPRRTERFTAAMRRIPLLPDQRPDQLADRLADQLHDRIAGPDSASGAVPGVTEAAAQTGLLRRVLAGLVGSTRAKTRAVTGFLYVRIGGLASSPSPKPDLFRYQRRAFFRRPPPMSATSPPETNAPSRKAPLAARLTDSLRRRLTKLVVLGALAGGLGVAGSAEARVMEATRHLPQKGIVVIGDDPGGYIDTRLEQIRRLRQTNQPVQIRGSYCNSTCTMFIGLPNACVEPQTEFGFHGPSYSGRRMPRAEFDHWSRIMAAHYPAQVADWFMETARKRIRGLHTLRGDKLIRMGVARCPRATVTAGR